MFTEEKYDAAYSIGWAKRTISNYYTTLTYLCSIGAIVELLAIADAYNIEKHRYGVVGLAVIGAIAILLQLGQEGIRRGLQCLSMPIALILFAIFFISFVGFFILTGMTMYKAICWLFASDGNDGVYVVHYLFCTFISFVVCGIFTPWAGAMITIIEDEEKKKSKKTNTSIDL